MAKLEKKYAKFAAEKAIELLNIDSPSGFTKKASEWVAKEFAKYGCKTDITNKGAVLITFPSEGAAAALNDTAGTNGKAEGGVLFEAHADTLGAMVQEIKGSGRLKITNIGGLRAANTETENVNIYTREGRIYEGTIQLINPSIHVNKDAGTKERDFDTVEVVIDEIVNSDEDVRKLGIEIGDYVCPNPRAHITESGYIKSRYLDDKLSVAILLGFAKYLFDKKITVARPTYALVTVYEEVGHGGSASIPEGITEAISVDMGCVGDGVRCKETQVSICAKDSGGPYDFDVTDKLVKAAQKEKADYAIDVYPYYGSDVEATLRAGHDIRHGLIGAGVFASHGYERSHIDGVYATLQVIKGYLSV